MNLAQHVALTGLRIYRRVLSPLKNALLGCPETCRFTPTCSQYAGEAIERHGVVVGSAYSIRRLCRCHPWGGVGLDPVPERVRIIS
ncbi:MAG TPA: membrane protein insertion efficiency factor YidD [Verrucomicrobiota bacterium]|nr:membrane protein insertion efficiency factor YidD [Verrucomicrobiales bacterium]HRI12636.1 membrane protein insertion efficiency factor YidD [Verrucomicrobiota bacterium]